MTPEDIQLTILLILVIICLALCFWFFERPATPNVPRYTQETRPRDLPSGSKCSLEEAAEIAFRKKGTLLHINTGHIYRSEPRQQHAEEIFVNTTSISASDISSIWIKNSPCANCSRRLIDHFSMTDKKPTIHIGKIWDGDNRDNRESLINMRMEGFTLKVWNTPKNCDSQQQQTREYLAEL